MKRVLVRLSVLSGVVVLGLIAIAQAQRIMNAPTQPRTSEPSADTVAVDEGEPAPIPIPGESRSGAPGESRSGDPVENPFAAPGGSSSPDRDDTYPVRATAAYDDPVARAAADDLGPTEYDAPRRDFPPAATTGEFDRSSDALPTRDQVAQVDVTAPADGDRYSAEDGDRYPAPRVSVGERTPARERVPGSDDRYSNPPPAPAPRYGDVEAGPPPARRPAALTVSPDNGIPPARETGLAAPADPHEPSDLRGPSDPRGPSTGAAFTEPDDRPGESAGPPRAEGTGTPGDRQLEGLQSPSVSIQKTAPAEVQVGKPATFKITVVNTGKIAAQHVQIRDVVPRGTELVSTTPRASLGARGELVWDLDTLQPGEAASVNVQLLPTAEGEIGSVATVHIAAQASARTVSTRPELILQVAAPREVMIGDRVTLDIKISNPGTGGPPASSSAKTFRPASTIRPVKSSNSRSASSSPRRRANCASPSKPPRPAAWST